MISSLRELKHLCKIHDLQEDQFRLSATFYSTVALCGPEHPSVEVIRSEYEQIVAELVNALGPKASCAEVDLLTWDVYTSLMNETGRKPSFVTLQTAKDFILSH